MLFYLTAIARAIHKCWIVSFAKAHRNNCALAAADRCNLQVAIESLGPCVSAAADNFCDFAQKQYEAKYSTCLNSTRQQNILRFVNQAQAASSLHEVPPPPFFFFHWDSFCSRTKRSLPVPDLALDNNHSPPFACSSTRVMTLATEASLRDIFWRTDGGCLKKLRIFTIDQQKGLIRTVCQVHSALLSLTMAVDGMLDLRP